MRTFIHRFYHSNEEERNAWVAAQARTVPTGVRVLDVGAGLGPYRSLFAHCEYRTQDFAATPDFSGRYTRLDYVSDILKIPVGDASFDVILCTEVLEHVPDPYGAVKEFGRILKSGGKLILTAPLGSHLHQEPYHFYGGYTPHWYRHFLGKAGFEVESIEPNMGFFGLFAQEGVRCSVYLDPRRAFRQGFFRGCLLTCLWLLTLPFLRILLPLMRGLDRWELERMTTVGYHVVAIRKA